MTPLDAGAGVDGEHQAEHDVEELDYVEQGGRGIRQLAAGETAAESQVQADGGAELLDEPKWTEETCRDHLRNAGSIVHDLWGVADSDWEMSEKDLDRMAGPISRLLERYEPTARLAAVSDPLLLAYGVGAYSYRSLLQARAARMKQSEEEEWQEEALATYDVPGEDELDGEAGASAQRPSPNGRAADLRFPTAARGG